MSFFKYVTLIFVMSINLFSFGKSDDYSARYIYQNLKLESSISYKVFEKAYLLNKKQNNTGNAGIYSIIDFSKPSNIKRFVIIDSHRNKVLMREYVSHGRNTGQLYAKNFSNKNSSHQSSLGIYKTAETYYGKYGYSLKLDGISKTNSNARKRYIVLHPAKYATKEFLDKNGYLGRSWGCPSVDPKVSKQIIELIKGGSYIYAFN